MRRSIRFDFRTEGLGRLKMLARKGYPVVISLVLLL